MKKEKIFFFIKLVNLYHKSYNFKALLFSVFFFKELNKTHSQIFSNGGYCGGHTIIFVKIWYCCLCWNSLHWEGSKGSNMSESSSDRSRCAGSRWTPVFSSSERTVAQGSARSRKKPVWGVQSFRECEKKTLPDNHLSALRLMDQKHAKSLLTAYEKLKIFEEP